MITGGGQAAGGILAAAVSVLGSLWAAAQSTAALARDTVDACAKLVPPSGQAFVHAGAEKGETVVDLAALTFWVGVSVAGAFGGGWLFGRLSRVAAPTERLSPTPVRPPLPSPPPPPPRGKCVGVSPLAHCSVDARYL